MGALDDYSKQIDILSTICIVISFSPNKGEQTHVL
jgi:hypothetical protein